MTTLRTRLEEIHRRQYMKISPRTSLLLITELCLHFVQHDSLSEAEYNNILDNLNTQRRAIGWNICTTTWNTAKANLLNRRKSWMSRFQRELNSDIATQRDVITIIYITPIWKTHILLAMGPSNTPTTEAEVTSDGRECECDSECDCETDSEDGWQTDTGQDVTIPTPSSTLPEQILTYSHRLDNLDTITGIQSHGETLHDRINDLINKIGFTCTNTTLTGRLIELENQLR